MVGSEIVLGDLVALKTRIEEVWAKIYAPQSNVSEVDSNLARVLRDADQAELQECTRLYNESLRKWVVLGRPE